MSSYSERDTYSQAGDWLLGTVRRNPEALAADGRGRLSDDAQLVTADERAPPRARARSGIIQQAGLPQRSTAERQRARVKWSSVFVVPEGQRPHPRRPDWRSIGLEDAAD
jgi:hypothetical protein